MNARFSEAEATAAKDEHRKVLHPMRDWDWRQFLFYIGVPLLVAVYAALNNWAVLQVAGYSGTLAFYIGHAFIPWWTTCIVTWLVMRALTPWQPHQLIVLTLGTVLACFIIQPYSQWLTEYFATGWLEGDVDGALSSAHIHDKIGFWTFLLRASAVWIAVNLVFDRLLGLPRYRYGAAGATAIGTKEAAADAREEAQQAPDAPRFLQRLPANVTVDQVIALKAEQHYVKVYTSERSFMTLYRFSDAVAEMAPETGQQVHRSYWVRTDAIKSVKREARKYFVQLDDDLMMPVSAPNRGLIRQLARQRNIPIYPPL